jgi:hypothetical protein
MDSFGSGQEQKTSFCEKGNKVSLGYTEEEEELIVFLSY